MYTRVILPERLWIESSNKEELKRAISSYMARLYPHYRVIETGKYYAICEG